MRQHEPVHTTGLRADESKPEIAGQPASVEAVFDDFDEHDRLGIVIACDDGAAGAAALTLIVRALNDRTAMPGQPARGRAPAPGGLPADRRGGRAGDARCDQRLGARRVTTSPTAG
jgi:hypothetical protein